MVEKSRNKVINLSIYILGLFCSVILIDYIIYITGGTQFAYVHLMYIPIIISAFIFGIKGGVLFAFFAGITLGSFMPMNVSQGIMQDTASWIIRLGIFIIMSLVAGFLFQHIRRDRDLLRKNAYENMITGLPNASKLKLDLNRIINCNKQKNFSLIIFKIKNLQDINRYVNYKTGTESIFNLIESLTDFFCENNLYSIHTDEMAIVMPECNIEDAYIKAKKILNKLKEPIIINDLPVSIVIKVGIVNFPLHSKEINDLFQKMDIVLDETYLNEEEIAIYDSSRAEKSRENYNTLLSLYDAIKNDEFTLMYQPKINLMEKKVIGVEALLRWSDSLKGNMNTERFIKIAENAGIISDITKWVIRNAIIQLKEWKKEGIEIKIAINISPKDLKDNSIIEYAKECIKLNKIDPAMLEFEITERIIIENKDKAEKLLSNIKEMGMKLSLDDFGTGYNSLIYLVRLPLDYIKIDKSFINNIKQKEYGTLTQSIINLMHTLGKEVIAEGVETGEQINILKEMHCDNIQGYYFSKPLQPEELSTFIQNFKNFEKVKNI